jgi:predicted membrane-bound mannosyltransferase
MTSDTRCWAGLAQLAKRPELLAWLAVLGLALALRFHDLGGMPLDPGEASLAMEAYSATGPGRGWGAGESAHPALASGLSTIFYLFGASDASARLVSALAGWATVGALWWTRTSIGAYGALGAAALLAVSPSHIDLSRSATPAALTGLSLTVVVLIAQSSITKLPARSICWVVGGSALAIGLGTDSTFALHLLVLAAAVLFAFEIAVVRQHAANLRLWSWWTLIRAFVVVALVMNARLGTNLGGVQAGLIDNLWMWSTELLAAGRLPLLPLLHVLGT